MAAVPSHRRTILFVDVVASTELYEELGDEGARARMAPCLEELQIMITDHGGTVVKSLGDGILAAFDGEDAAVGSALGMVGCAARHSLQVSTGVHTGEVLVDAGDMFGQAVNVAARLSGLARPSEILVTRDVLDRLPPARRSSALRLQNVTIKGLRDPLELFALGHAGPAATMSVSSDFAATATPASRGLAVRKGDRTWTVGRGGSLRLGRDPGNDIVVEGDRVSRQHATVVERRGKHVIVDQSVNGTWLLPHQGNPAHLLRDEATLHGSGSIVLGVPPEDPAAVLISYRSSA